MADLDDDPVTAALLDAIAEAPGVRVVAIKVLDTSPFTVSINGAGSVPGLVMGGHSFSLGATGYALWSPPSLPICFTAT